MIQHRTVNFDLCTVVDLAEAAVDLRRNALAARRDAAHHRAAR